MSPQKGKLKTPQLGLENKEKKTLKIMEVG